MKRSFLILSMLLSPAIAAAQGPRQPSFTTTVQPDALPAAVTVLAVADTSRPDELGMALGGVIAMVTGVFVGGYAGGAIEYATGCAGDWCGLSGALIGATAGSTIMAPLGVHLVNKQRGNFGRALGVSALIAAAGWAATLALDEDGTPILLIPFAQIISAIAVETGTTPPAD